MLFNTANSKFSRFNLIGLLVFVSLLMTGCGGAGSGGGSKGGPASSYTIGGTISGLAGPVVLQDMGGDNLTIPADGKFTFAIPINNGNLYNVTVLTQPSGQTCSISSGSGIVSGNTVANVAIFCSSLKYNVGGTISGLTGSVTLQNNTGDNLILTTTGSYTFTTQVAYNSPYSVTVLTQPTGNQTCSVANASGTMTAANVTNVNITCATSTYQVGGTVSGFNTSNAGPITSLKLQNNGGDELTITTNNSFHFNTALSYGIPYNVGVSQLPSGQGCSVTAGSGIIQGVVNDVLVSCGNLMGGSVQGNALNLTPTVSTVIGALAGQNGIGQSARFSTPLDAVSDGTNLYVADAANNKIRKIVIATGEVTTFAGSLNNVAGAAEGVGTAATFNYPSSIATDGTSLYVTDTYNYKIRKIDIATATVSSLTGPSGAAAAYSSGTAATCGYACDTGAPNAAYATFSYPQGITYLNNNLYVTEYYNNKIRKVTTSGNVSSFTGTANTSMGVGSADGTAVASTFANPAGITTDGAFLYVVDRGNSKIRKITILDGAVTSVTGSPSASSTPGSGDGAVVTATFNYPWGIATDGVNLYVADPNNNKIRKIDMVTGMVSSMTGMVGQSAPVGATEGSGRVARFTYPQGITYDGNNLYVMDTGNNMIRTMSVSPVTVSLLAGVAAGVDGTGTAASLTSPHGIATDGANIYVADSAGNKIRKVVIATGAVTTLAGTGAYGALDGQGIASTFSNPQGVTTDGINVYVADTGNNKIRQINIATGAVSSLTGPANAAAPFNSGPNVGATCGYACDTGATGATVTTFNNPVGITIAGSNLYVVDTFNYKIRKVVIATGAVSSLTGPPNAAAVSNSGTTATCGMACDTGATNASYATFNFTTLSFFFFTSVGGGGITTDGTNLYVVDTANNKIRKVVIATGAVYSLTGPANAAAVSGGGVGGATCGMACDGSGLNSTFAFLNPNMFFFSWGVNNIGITTDGSYLYVADIYNNKVRKVDASTGATTTLTGTGAQGAANDGLTSTFFNPSDITTDGTNLYVTDTGNNIIRKIK